MSQETIDLPKALWLLTIVAIYTFRIDIKEIDHLPDVDTANPNIQVVVSCQRTPDRK
jgi:hypothetical protein